jgi:hypothetical protein
MIYIYIYAVLQVQVRTAGVLLLLCASQQMMSVYMSCNWNQEAKWCLITMIDNPVGEEVGRHTQCCSLDGMCHTDVREDARIV